MTAEIVLRTAAVLACTTLVVLLLSAPRRRAVHWLGAVYCLSVAAFVLTSVRAAESLLGPLLLPLTALCVTKAAWFWLFARALFHEGFRVERRHGVLLVAVAAYGLWQQLIYVPAAPAGTLAALASLGFEAVVAAFVSMALLEAWRGMAADLVERRRRVRVAFVALGGAYLAVVVVVQVHHLLLNVSTPQPLVLANLALIFILCAAAAVSLSQPRSPAWLEPERAAAADSLTTRERAVLEKLRHAMEKERIYREEGLTIARLAARLAVREHQLRRVINSGLGFRNFNDFLHAYRIGEATKRLGSPEESGVPVLSIALDVGYGSIGPFNRAFKSRTGMTPSTFRRRAGRETPAHLN